VLAFPRCRSAPPRCAFECHRRASRSACLPSKCMPDPFPLTPLKLPRPLVAQAELQARWSTHPRGRHCCPVGAHGEIHLRPLFTADTCCSRLPLAPTEVPPPLVGHAEPPARRSNTPAAAATDLRRTRLPVVSPPQVSTQTGPAQPLAPPQPLPGRARRRGRRNFTGRAAPKLQGLHCKASSDSGVFCANQGPCCEPTDLSRGLQAK
jgi:hypothetical protein